MIQHIKDNNTLLQLSLILGSIAQDVCLVGGSVRDSLISEYHNTPVNIKDFDIVLNGNLDIIYSTLVSNGWKVSEAGKQFLVMIASKNEQSFEIALYRKDGTYTDGRRPDSVDVGTIYDDANRRDFTINALYYDILHGVYIDPTGQGIEHIQQRKLQFVGSAKARIMEDKLRIMRAYRFAITKGFSMDNKTHSVIRRYFEDMIQSAPSARIMQELDKML